MKVIREIREVITASMTYQIILLQRKLDISEKKRSELEKELKEIRVYLAKRHKIHSV